jgi:D-tyrosyl-tRNA(Tyr) deacylase
LLATVQRVSNAEIVIDDDIFTSISDGCLMFVCVEKDDVSQNINNMVNKLLNFRMLDGPKGITSSPLNDSGKEVLIVSQFTLAAITNKGNKPSFHKAAEPGNAKLMYDEFVREFKKSFPNVKEGKFGAFMEISLTNIGPVTFNFKT